MSTPEYDDDLYDDESGDQPSEPAEAKQQQPGWRKKLERDAKAGREAVAAAEQAKAEAAAAKRDLLIAKAGIDSDKGPGKLFARAYDGELTLDAIKAAAQEYGVLAPAAPAVPPAEAAAVQRVQEAQAGGVPTDGAVDFTAEIDGIPMIVNGQYNPDYQAQVFEAARKQAAREGRELRMSNNPITGWQHAGPVTTPSG